MRRAFEPVLISVSGLQTATWQYFYSETGNPDADAKVILETSLTGINEARAQIWLEEGVLDFAAELERVFKGFQTIQRELRANKSGRGSTTGDEAKQAFADVNEGATKIRQLVGEHMRAVERAV